MGFKGLLVTSAAVQGTSPQNLSPLIDLTNDQLCKQVICWPLRSSLQKYVDTDTFHVCCPPSPALLLSLVSLRGVVHPDFPKLDRALSQFVAIWKGGFTLSFLARHNFRHFSHLNNLTWLEKQVFPNMICRRFLLSKMIHCVGGLYGGGSAI